MWFVTEHVRACECVHASVCGMEHQRGQGSWGRYLSPGRGRALSAGGLREPGGTPGPPGMFPALVPEDASLRAATHLGGESGSGPLGASGKASHHASCSWASRDSSPLDADPLDRGT